MRKLISLVLPLVAIVSCNNTDYTAFVDPFIGSGGHGHVCVGASVPFGAVQVGPTSIPRDWDWCSGYHESDSSVVGFSFTHLSGTGIGDLCDINILPVAGTDVTTSREGIADTADRSQEVCTPGFYSVPLIKSGVLCQMTATDHCGVIKFVFPQDNQDRCLVFNLKDGGNTDSDSVKTGLEFLNPCQVVGFRFSHGWAPDQKVFFAAELSEPIKENFISEDGDYYFATFKKSVKEITIKLSISPVSSRYAILNLDAETKDVDFETVKSQARQAWNAELSKVDVKSENLQNKKIFYTSLFHSMIQPSHFSDSGKSVRYSSLSLWDTYRAWAPLFTILHPEKENDYINSFLDIFDKQGKLPIWHLYGNETNCMVGTPAVPIVSDAILKGFDGFDHEKAFQAMKASSLNPERGQGARMEYGFIPSDIFTEAPVAYEMEYALSDWALAQAAKKLGHEDDYQYFIERSKSYKRHFDPETGFMRGVKSDGSWTEPFSPFFSNHFFSDYCEGNGWQYTWLVPHDFEGLCECFKSYKNYTGSDTTGREALLQKLDSLFVVSSVVEGENASPDISGLIGQYAHGNEPSHHTTYMYCYAGQPYKTADLVSRICKELYSATADGICGNEDCGQMSAWYVLSAMGFYQIEPAGGRYFFGTPLFDEMKIKVGDKKTFVIKASGLSEDSRYIRKIKLNGEPYTKAWIDYADIMAGGKIEFTMSSEPGTWY